MKSLSSTRTHELTQRLPKIELSYETIPHKKVSSSYNACVAIPLGKKCYAWFSFDEERDVCYIMETNREKKISKISVSDIKIGGLNKDENKLCLGTIFYGTMIYNGVREPTVREPNTNNPLEDWVFIIEDILYYQGIPMKTLYFGERLGFLERVFKAEFDCMGRFRLPIIWPHNTNNESTHERMDFFPEYIIPPRVQEICGYQIHHIQYRCLNDTLPYLNVAPPQKFKMKDTALVSKDNAQLLAATATTARATATTGTTTAATMNLSNIVMVSPLDYRKPQYRLKSVFQVCADIQFDIYHLFAYGKNSSIVYYNIACIPNYKTSVFMNGIFRNIKENANLDAIEESDDEDEFENMAEDRFVDLQKTVLMECVFNTKFKKWVPLRIVDTRREKNVKVVHIGQLVSYY